jgi:hypothetical protein
LLLSDKEEDLKKSESYAAKAADQFMKMAESMGKVDDLDLDRRQDLEAIINLIKQAQALEEQGVSKEGSLAEAKRKQAEEDARSYKQVWEQAAGDVKKIVQETASDSLTQLTLIATKAQEIASTPIQPKVDFDYNTSLLALRETIQEISKPIVIPVTYQVQNRPTGQSSGTSDEASAPTEPPPKLRWGGMVQRFARGGWNVLAGLLPGWGGGDRVRAMLEPGEYIVRKEAVSRYGAGLFAALNNMALDLPRLAGSLMPNLPNIPRAASAGGTGEALTVRFETGGSVYPVDIHDGGSKTMMKQFLRELEKMRLTRG